MSYLKKILTNAVRVTLLVSVLLTFGGGSTLLQGVAWVSMFTGELEKDVSVEEALKNTFDGKKPCELCLAADKLRQGEQDVPAPDKNDPAPTKPAPKKLCDGFVFSEAFVAQLKVSECDRGWHEMSKSWVSLLNVDVVTPPPQSV